MGVSWGLDTSTWGVRPCTRVDRRTKRPNRLPPVLSRRPPSQATPIRGAARLLRRRALVARGGQGLWLFGRVVPGAVSPLPPRGAAGLFRVGAAWAPDAAPEDRRARHHRGPAETEFLGLRDQRGVTGSGHAAQSDRRAGGAQGGGVCALAAPPG